jgi:Dna[CI] antecedent, DciA
MEPIRHTLQRIMAESLKRMPAADAVVEAWPMVCGEAVARNAKAVLFANDALTVEVSDKTWRGQLQDMKLQYCSALTRLSGHKVERIEFVLASFNRTNDENNGQRR